MSLTYTNYLKLDELLSLQKPKSEGKEHDEMLFIIIHQVYELWFKEILHEMDYLQKKLTEGKLPSAQHTLKRILTILKVIVAQIDILETITPLEFLSFRERLEQASGLQSFQFRELEFVLGNKRPEVLQRYAAGSPQRELVEKRLGAPTLWDSFLQFLSIQGLAIPAHLLRKDFSQPTAPSPELQKILIKIYREDALLAEFCERLVDLDEGIQEWRYRHVKMVERTIGSKEGTGGSSGAEYLKQSLFKPLFPDLWIIRTQF